MTFLKVLSIASIATCIASCSPEEPIDYYPRNGNLLTEDQRSYIPEAARKTNDACPIDSYINKDVPINSPEFQQSLIDHTNCEMIAIYLSEDKILIDWTVGACIEYEYVGENNLFDAVTTTREDYVALCASGRIMSASPYYN